MHLFKEERTIKTNLPPTLDLRNHCTIKIKLIENNYKKIFLTLPIDVFLDSILISFPIPVFNRLTLIMGFFSFRKTNFYFHFSSGPVKL